MRSKRVERFSLVRLVSALMLSGCAAAVTDRDLRAELLEKARADQGAYGERDCRQ